MAFEQGLPNLMPGRPGYHLFTSVYQKLFIFVSILGSPVAREVIRATKHNEDLSTPDRYALRLVLTGLRNWVQLNWVQQSYAPTDSNNAQLDFKSRDRNKGWKVGQPHSQNVVVRPIFWLSACLCSGPLIAKPNPGKSNTLPSTDYLTTCDNQLSV